MSMPAPAVEGLGAAFGGRGRGDGGRGEGGAGEGGRRAGGAEEHLQGPRQEALPERCRNQRGCICMAGPAHCNAGPGTAAQAVQKGSQRLMLPLPASPVGEVEGLADAGAGVFKHVDGSPHHAGRLAQAGRRHNAAGQAGG